MSDTKIMLEFMTPLRECFECPWKGVILSEAVLNPGAFFFEPEHPSVLNPDRAKFCPVCGELLKVRE